MKPSSILLPSSSSPPPPHNDEERTSLTAPATAPATAATTTATSTRWQRLLSFTILMGCIFLYIWDSIDFDTTPTGDAVVFKLYNRGNGNGGSASSNGKDSITSSTVGDDDDDDDSKHDNISSSSNITSHVQQSQQQLSSFDGEDITNSKVMLQRLERHRNEWIENTLKKDYGEEYYYDIFEPLSDDCTDDDDAIDEEEEEDDDNNKTSPSSDTRAARRPKRQKRVHVGKQRAFVDPNRLPSSGQKYEDVTKNGDGSSSSSSSSSIAWKRMIRKFTIKILQIQINMLYERKQQQQQQQEQEQAQEQQQQPSSDNKDASAYYSQFVWMNGGHSASAGHGNFYENETYTATVQKDLSDLLGYAIGLQFVVKNYAMGATESGEEIGLCFNSIFGKNIDSISWDYGMTDGGEYWKTISYAYNAARLSQIKNDDNNNNNNVNSDIDRVNHIRHRPSLWFLHTRNDQHPVLQSLQNLGLPLLVMDTFFQNEKMKSAFPDMFGKTDEEIGSYAPFVQYFKCNGQIESGDPGCNEYKFNMTFCPERGGRNTWHPGWRYHALVGHAISFTILELITQSLQNLIKLEVHEETAEQKLKRLSSLLDKLDALEQQDYDNMFHQPIPIELKRWFVDSLWKGEQREANKEAMQEFPIETMVHDPHFCHTAVLPAEIRYKGFLTENFDDISEGMNYSIFERGVMHKDILEVEVENGENSTAYVNPRPGHEDQMFLGSYETEWEEWCPVLTRIDHKDYFYVSSVEGWRKLTLPNNAEQEYYNEFNPQSSKGYILICMAICEWNCKEGDMHDSVMDGSLNAEKFGRLEIEVNGVKVSDVKCMNKCCALRHDGPDSKDQFIWNPNEENKYEIQTRIVDATEYSFARFSSFIFL